MTDNPVPSPAIAVLIPCHNEEKTVADVVSGMRASLPGARIFVYDNASTDSTARKAAAAGATVRSETKPGKGNVVRRMFADVEADIYVIVDGDDTYDCGAAPALVAKLVGERLDLVVGTRAAKADGAYRRGHRFGNRVLTGLVARLFGFAFTDMLSGYRVMSRRFVKSFPSASHGFEIETELTIHALELRAPSGELLTAYGERPEGSVSNLRTYRDGMRILLLILRLTERERPLLFYGTIAAVLALTAAGLSVPVIGEYLAAGLVSRQPTWILAVGLGVLSALALTCGLVLNALHTARLEAKRLAYLALPFLP